MRAARRLRKKEEWRKKIESRNYPTTKSVAMKLSITLLMLMSVYLAYSLPLPKPDGSNDDEEEDFDEDEFGFDEDDLKEEYGIREEVEEEGKVEGLVGIKLNGHLKLT